MNLAGLVDAHAGDRRALCGPTGWSTWGEIRAAAASLRDGLVALGISPGDRVALAWPTSMEFVVGYLGALAAGATVVPLNPASPRAELERELDFVDPAAVVCGGSCAEEIAAICESHADGPALVAPGVGSQRGSADWHALTDGSGVTAALLGAVDRDDGDVAVMLFTSGTAGSPRLAMLTHGNLVSNLRQMLDVPGTLLGGDDVGLAAVPLHHVFGLNVVLGLTLATGAGLVCEERFDPAEALDLVERRGVTVVAGAPPMFADWARVAEDGERHFSHVRLVLSGASALEPETAERFTSRFGVPLWQGYGLTEASPAVATSVGLEAPRPGSVGRPLPGLSLKLVDESGEDALCDDPGEIWVRGPNVFAGYWRDPDATRAVLDSARWLHTGDVGVLDDAGELHVVDRLKDLIIVSGFNVIPSEVEQVIRGIEGVKETVVFGVPDLRTGESVEALVVPEAGAEPHASDIVDRCAVHLAHYKVPKTVKFVDALPHGATGKTLRRLAREIG